MTTLIELEHLHNETDAALGSLTEAIDAIWTLVMAIVILLMQGGFAMLEAGAVRERSVRDILLKNIMDVSVCAMVWAAFGSMLASDTHGPFLGWRVLPNDTETPFEAIDVAQGEDMSVYFLGYLYAATSSTIVSGAIAERTQQRAYIILSCAMAGLIYPAVVHWLWTDRGWLSWTNEDAVLGGAYDFAGASVVHLTGGAQPNYARWRWDACTHSRAPSRQKVSWPSLPPRSSGLEPAGSTRETSLPTSCAATPLRSASSAPSCSRSAGWGSTSARFGTSPCRGRLR